MRSRKINLDKKLNNVAIVGKGRMGTSLKRALAYETSAFRLHSFISARSAKFGLLAKNGGPDVLIIATKDDAIAEVAKKAIQESGPNLQLIVHLAGSQPSTILPIREGVHRLVLHPIQSFPKPDASLFESITFVAASEEPEAIAWARQFSKALGAKGVLGLPNESLPLYHAMLVLGANSITLLVAMIEDLSTTLNLDPKKIKQALRPLLTTTLENAIAHPAMKVLTGPFSRGDSKTILAHKKALRKSSKEIQAVYGAMERYAEMKVKWN